MSTDNNLDRCDHDTKAFIDQTGENKIHAMIRELESHAPVETICAKRRLMADIAGRLERARKFESIADKSDSYFLDRDEHCHVESKHPTKTKTFGYKTGTSIQSVAVSRL